ncbi:MAG: hypothetical protein U5K69_10420 [Balneolaceae bacterium]|nr:hypothetical protein [Balneolaceae bacterium]
MSPVLNVAAMPIAAAVNTLCGARGMMADSRAGKRPCRGFRRLEITSVLVEAGQSLAGSPGLMDDYADELELFVSREAAMGEVHAASLDWESNHMKEVIELRDETWQEIGDDILLTGYL